VPSTTHTILNADALIALHAIPSDSIPLIITDPPFNIGKDYHTYKDRRTHEDYLAWCRDWLTECVRVMAQGAALYLINYPENNAYLLPFLDQHVTFKRWMTWHYPTNTGHSKTNWTRSQHAILYYIKGKTPRCFNKDAVALPYRNPKDKRIQGRLAAGSLGRTPDDVFEFNIVKNVSHDKTAHPCQLPVGLVETFVLASSVPGDTVLDPFGGSFTTAVACKKHQRSSISIELDAAFCAAGERRMAGVGVCGLVRTVRGGDLA
jgi:site-specific DNA-methyltransferase (adenine-specific)